MNMQDEVYKVVREVLSDGKEHSIGQLRGVLSEAFGLTKTQSSSRIHRMVDEGKVENSSRGFYRLSSKSNAVKYTEISGRLRWALRRIELATDSIFMNIQEFFQLTEDDKEIIFLLGDIRDRVQPAIKAYKTKVEGADEQKNSTSN